VRSNDERSPEFDEQHELAQEPVERVQDEIELEEEQEVEPERESADRYFLVMDVVERFFAGEELVDLDELESELTQEELEALRALQEATGGFAHGSTHTMYAEDRLRRLGEALAGLQPVLAEGLETHTAAALEEFQRMVDQVEELRGRLLSLEDAQEEIFAQDKPKEEARPPEAEDEGDKGEKGDEAASSLYGEPAVEPPPPAPSTLQGGPGEPAVEPPPAPSTLQGKPGEPAVERPERSSTLGDTPGGT